MPKGQSLYHKYPKYRVDLEPNTERLCVELGTETIAESERSLRVLETQHDPVFYIPREDIRMDLLERTDHETFCPFKGEASYWTIRTGDQILQNAAWSYEDPFEEVAGLKDYISFYTDRVKLTT